MEKYHAYILAKDDEDISESEDDAWLSCYRIFRGTTGKEPGVVYTKDLAYREGNAQLWSLLKKNPELLVLAYLGKWDINNPLHWRVLMNLGVIDKSYWKYIEDIETAAFENLNPKSIKKVLIENYSKRLSQNVDNVLG